jgi:hypothetical protein
MAGHQPAGRALLCIYASKAGTLAEKPIIRAIASEACDGENPSALCRNREITYARPLAAAK